MDRVVCKSLSRYSSTTSLTFFLVLDEWAFALKSEDQLLLHMNHNVPDRDIKLAGAWSSTEYPLNDRARLRTLMEDIDVRKMDPAEIIKRMPLPK